MNTSVWQCLLSYDNIQSEINKDKVIDKNSNSRVSSIRVYSFIIPIAEYEKVKQGHFRFGLKCV
jgi:hypothetical protein